MIEQLRAQLEQAKATYAVRVNENAEVTRVKGQIALMNNEKAINLASAIITRNHSTAKLEELEALCKTVVESMPIFSKATKENRKWQPSARYRFGNQMAILTRLASGIQYAATEHKQQMLAVTGLDADTVELLNEALGSLPYYSRNNMVVVDGLPTNVELLKQLIDVVNLKYNINIDTTMISQAVVNQEHTLALVRAKGQMEADLETLAKAGLPVDL